MPIAAHTTESPESGGRRPITGFGIVAMGIALLLIAPLLTIVAGAFARGEGAWAHLAATVLPDYLRSTFWLLVGVTIGVSLIGVSTAWLVATYRFPGHRAFEWLLALPLAMPAYVIAYAYTDLLQFSGPVQSAIREATGWRARGYWFPDIRSLEGAMAVFSLVLYPYVYLLARSAFLEQSVSLIEAGRLLGRGPWGTFFRVALPLSRPAIAVGTSLALMETLADFGAVSYFAVNTFTTGIYRAWLSLGDAVAASQLSLLLLLFVAVILGLERLNRGEARYYNLWSRAQPRLQQLSGMRAASAVAVCAVGPLFGFLIPVASLLHLVLTDPGPLFSSRFLSLTSNTLVLAGTTALIAVLVSTLMAYAARISGHRAVLLSNRVAALGYAIPGAVIAVGILVPVARLDNWIADWLADLFGVKTGLLLTGSIAALVYAYLVRFLAISLQTVEAGLGKIRPSMEDAARSLGRSAGETLGRVHLPMMRGSLLTAALIVFVDVMKELPATFAMRPFNFDTLAVHAYNMANDERLPEAAAASLVIVAAGLVPIVLLSRSITKGRRASG